MKNRLTLTEELKRMRGLMIYENGEYKNPLLTEETNTLPSINQSVVFGAGHYDMKGKRGEVTWDVEKTLQPPLTQIKNFLTKNPTGFIVNVILSAGESQIPNVDRTAGGDPHVKPGHLSTKRMGVLENYIQQVFNSWLKEGVIKDKINFIKKEPEIGKTPWVTQPFCPKDKLKSEDTEGYACSTTFYGNYIKKPEGKKLKQQYNKEQFLNVAINVEKIKEEVKSRTENNPSCLEGLEIIFGVPTHQCNNAEYFVFANQTLLTNTQGGNTANLNNASTVLDNIKIRKGVKLHPYLLNPGFGDPNLKNGIKKYGGGGDIKGVRRDKFIVTAEQSKQIFEQNKGKVAIWAVCTTGKCHKDLPAIEIIHNVDGKKIIVFNKGTKLQNVTNEGGLLCVLNQCGTKLLSNSDGGKSPDYTKYQQSLLDSRVALQEKDKKRYNFNRIKVGNDFKKPGSDSKLLLLNAIASLNDDVEEIYKTLNGIKGNTLKDKTKNLESVWEKLRLPSRNIRNIIKNNYLGAPPKELNLSPGIYKHLESWYKNDYKRHQKRNEILYKKKGEDGDMFGDIRPGLEEFWKKANKLFDWPIHKTSGLKPLLRLSKPLKDSQSISWYDKLISQLLKNADNSSIT
jgi:hypothetical protein